MIFNKKLKINKLFFFNKDFYVQIHIVTVKLQKTIIQCGKYAIKCLRSLIALFDDFFYSAFNNWNHLHHVCSIF